MGDDETERLGEEESRMVEKVAFREEEHSRV
jgi:hypothetical protein